MRPHPALAPTAPLEQHAIAALHPLVAADPRPEPAPSEQPPPAPAILVAGTRWLELQYELDPAANVWVANVLDPATGEVVRQVPSTRALHQLAELRRIDTRA